MYSLFKLYTVKFHGEVQICSNESGLLKHVQHYAIVVLSFIAYQSIMAGVGYRPNSLLWWIGGISFACAVYLFEERDCRRKGE